MISTFQNREEALNELCTPVTQSPLLNVYGEAGIGKSRLLKQAVFELQQRRTSAALVFRVDLEPLAKIESGRVEALLRAIIEQSQGRLHSVWHNVEQVAGKLVIQLSDLAAHTPVYLMFDTTEALQEDMVFWEWLQEHFIEPLVIDGRVKQIFAGRVPVPWRRFELRRNVKLLPIGPIKTYTAITDLIKEQLEKGNPNLQDDNVRDEAVDLVLEFSFGHPGLSEKIAEYVAPRWPVESPEDFEIELCKDVVKPFINQFLFEDIEPLWNEILWWASVLDWFDTTILQRYLGQLELEQVKGEPDYFFIQGIARLRTKNTVVWREEHGDRLHGVLRDIVRQCLKTMDPARYRKACSKVAETFQSIADEFVDEKDYAEQYSKQAELYQRRADNIKEKNNG